MIRGILEVHNSSDLGCSILAKTGSPASEACWGGKQGWDTTMDGAGGRYLNGGENIWLYRLRKIASALAAEGIVFVLCSTFSAACLDIEKGWRELSFVLFLAMAVRVAVSRLERVPRGILRRSGSTSQATTAGTPRLSPIDSSCI